MHPRLGIDHQLVPSGRLAPRGASDIPDGDYTLRIGFEHDAGASAQAKGDGRGPGYAAGTIGFTIDTE